MKVLKTTTEPQTFNVVPRVYASAGKVVLIEKDTRKTITLDAEFTDNGNYMSVSSSFALEEGSRYTLILTSSSGNFTSAVIEDGGTVESPECVEALLDSLGEPQYVIYRDMILCTDQTELDKYNIQEGEYIEANTTDNEYVVIND